MFNARLTAFAAAIALASPVNAQETTADTVVATVNGLEITVGHMIMARSSLPPQYQQIPDEQLFENLLNQMIQQAAIASTADGLSRRGEFVVENTRRSQFVEDTIAAELSEALTEDALQAAYQEAYASAEPEQEFSAAHILVETEEKAAELKAEIDQGADFAELARAYAALRPGVAEIARWRGLGAEIARQRELAAEAGAENVESDDDGHVVVTDVDAFAEVRDALEAKLGEAQRAALVWRPQTGAPMDEDAATTLLKLIDTLEDNDDVQRVASNFEIDDAVLAHLTA